MKMFVSYRSTDSKKVDPIVARLRSLKYEVWQDKDNIPVGQDWWEAICDGIVLCDVFLFMLSSKSIVSAPCLAELSFAYRLNLPIIAFVLEGEWKYGNDSKPEIAYWSDLPSDLVDNRSQLLFYEEENFVNQFNKGVDSILRKNLRRFIADPPPDPRLATDASNNVTVIYEEAYDSAFRGEFDTAEKLFRKLVSRNDPVFGDFAHKWVNIIRAYQRVKDMAERPSTRKFAQDQWLSYIQQFPLKFIDGIFDPHKISILLESSGNDQVALPASNIQIHDKLGSVSIVPAPFEWIEIPSKDYQIAKYPITNAQFRKFIEADSYNNKEWWTEIGWKAKEDSSAPKWTMPLYWNDPLWNQADQPVVGISWYEALAFCRWLSEMTGEQINLPTVDQWQYAAQSDDGRTYPWGNHWNSSFCNNGLDKQNNGRTTPVRKYLGKGDSPFAVVDMAGNVWEWSLTDYDSRTNNVDILAVYRVALGGSWTNKHTINFRCVENFACKPDQRDKTLGFRIVQVSL